MVRKKIVYCDSNVYIDAFENEEVRRKLLQVGEKYFVIYSRENILEFLSPRYADRLQGLLELVRTVTRSSFLRHDVSGYRMEATEPESIYSEIINDPTRDILKSAEDAIHKMQVEKAKGRKEVREKLGLSPNELNNVPPDKIIAWIDQALTRIANETPQTEKPPPRNLNEVLDLVLGFHCEAHLQKTDPGSKAFRDSVVQAGMAICFSLFDQFGYWSDNPRNELDFSNTNRDMLHTTVGFLAFVFLTRDQGFRNKTMAVYHRFNIPCQVMDTMPGLDYLLTQDG